MRCNYRVAPVSLMVLAAVLGPGQALSQVPTQTPPPVGQQTNPGAETTAAPINPAHMLQAKTDEPPHASVPDSGDIVVTAQRREQKLQDVPLAITALGSRQLQNAVVQNVTNLDGKIPNVIAEPVGLFPFAGAYSIRGLGYADVESSSEPTVGVEVDGVYQARNIGTVQDFFDVEQVSILRGPQGTLYGRNTIGGVVSIQTKRPGDEFHAEAVGTLGSYGRREIRGAVEGPVIRDLLSVRISALGTHYSGYYHNDFAGYGPVNGKHLGRRNVFGIRGTAVLTPANNFNATLTIDHSNETGDGNPAQNVSLPFQVLSKIGYPQDPAQQPYHTSIAGETRSDLRTTGETLEVNWSLGGAKITSVTGYRHTDSQLTTDFDGIPIPFLVATNAERHHQFSEELRLASNNKNSRLNYVFGLYYLDQYYNNTTSQYGIVFGGPTLGSAVQSAQTTKSYAAFGQVDYKVFDKLTVTVGGRYSADHKDFEIQPLFFTVSKNFTDTFHNFSPKVGVNYQWTPDILTYVQYSKGYRAGGFNGRAGTFNAVGPYGSEKIESWEGGVKSELLDRHLTLNLAAFTEKYLNVQETVIQVVPGTNINQTLTANAANAKLKGLEGEATARLGRGFVLNGTVGYLDAKFNNFMADLGDGLGDIDRSNLPFSFAPKWNASVTGTYTVRKDYGTFTLQGSGRYQSKIYTTFTPYNILTDQFVRPKNISVDASLTFEAPEQRWRVTVYGKNLSNLHLMNNSFAIGSLDALRIYQPPREFGVQLGVHL